jgi:hypothetical protein
MKRDRKRKIIVLSLGLLVASLLLIMLNAKSVTRQGIDCVVTEHQIPLWLKSTEFLSRHYHYKQLAYRITDGCQTDEAKTIALFEWTRQNIKAHPAGFTVYDDHVLNIIIRGFGTNDQSADVFTTLCTYAGIPAAIYQALSSDKKHRIILSAVCLDGRYLLFDTYYGNYFRNKNGQIASIEDMISDPSLVGQAKNKPIVHGITYVDYFRNLSCIDGFGTLRAELQMPLARLKYELKRRLGLTEPAILFYGTRLDE